MSSFLIARLPSHPKSLEAVEFMQKNDLSFRISSNSFLLNALMASGGMDSQLTILFEQGFQRGEEDRQLIDRIASIFPVKSEVQGDEEHLGMDFSQVPDNLNSERHLRSEAADALLSRRPAESVKPLRVEAILGHAVIAERVNIANSTSIAHDLTDDSKNSVVPEPSFGGNAPESMDFHENAVLDGPDDVRLNAKDLMDDYEDEEEVEEGDEAKEDNEEQEGGEMEDEECDNGSEDEEKKGDKGHRARDVQKKMEVRRSPISVGRLLFACPVKNCSTSYKKFEDLKEHIKCHKDEKKALFCDVCKKTFSSIEDAMEHIRQREAKECCGCGKKSPYLPHLNVHHRHHTGEKPYSCGQCKKRFSSKTAIKKHELWHSGIKPFSCGLCDYKTNVNYNMKKHMRIHTGEKPYSCEKCGAKFSERFPLNRHLKSRVHN